MSDTETDCVVHMPVSDRVNKSKLDHYVRDEVMKGTIKLVKTHTDDDISDIYTKVLDKATFTRHRDKLVAKD